ncbi:hypothetical protein M378DRAFT_57442, partial [Amanita muscaria Koide BX008]
DYIYRPTEIEDMCLYDWVRRCKRVKLKAANSSSKQELETNLDDDLYEGTINSNGYEDSCDELSDSSELGEDDENNEDEWPPRRTKAELKLPKNTHRFTDSHPLHSTHGTQVKSDNSKVVANFIGKPLPRCDHGDREYYCLTMLAFFKPWRDGLSLKERTSTWDDAFISHPFTGRQLQLIKNFNIKYECLDARDDYNAQRKKGLDGGFFQYGEEHKGDIDSFDPDVFVQTNTANDTEDTHDHEAVPLGKAELRRQREAGEIRSVMERTGWTDELHSCESKDSKPAYKPIMPQYMLSGS